MNVYNRGNEKNCICHKPKDKHTKLCDNFRLSEFLIRAAGTIKRGKKNGE